MLKDLLRGKPRDITPKNRCGCFDSLGGSGGGDIGFRVVKLSEIGEYLTIREQVGPDEWEEGTSFCVRVDAFPAEPFLLVSDMGGAVARFVTPDGELITDEGGDASANWIFRYPFIGSKGYHPDAAPVLELHATGDVTVAYCNDGVYSLRVETYKTE